MNPNLNTNKDFREQVKVCLKTHLVQIPIYISVKYYQKKTRVLALVIFYDNSKTITKRMFRVLNCVIYTIISKYICIDYLCSEKAK